MHVEKGIGRAGFRLLALVFWAFGMMGLGTAWYAFVEGTARFLVLGLGLAALGLLVLVVFAFLLTQLEPSSTPAQQKEAPAPPRPETPRPTRPESAYEFPDAEPAPLAAPEELVLPHAFRSEPPVPTPPASAPPMAASRPVASGEMVLFESTPVPRSGARGVQQDGKWPAKRTPVPRPGQQTEPETPGRLEELQQRYTQGTPMVREILGKGPRDAPAASSKPPEVQADRMPEHVDPDWLEGDRMRGQCGQCGTMLLAPRQRPIRLKCPVCEKVTLLE